MTYAIEKNIPIPAGASARQVTAPKYRWEELEIGDSIFVEESEVPEGKTLKDLRNRVYNAARAYGTPKGKKFLALVVEEERDNPELAEALEEGRDVGDWPLKILVKGVRCWYESDLPKPHDGRGPG
jgi:hypothetical protein